jgi:hypothetical protein
MQPFQVFHNSNISSFQVFHSIFNDLTIMNIYVEYFLNLNIFHMIKTNMMCHIFKHFKSFMIQIFSKFKYDVPHILEKI